MIPSLCLWLLKSTVCSGIFFGYYWLALRHQRMHQFNRFYLLAATLLSFIIPLSSFHLFTVAPENVAHIPLLQIINDNGREEIAAAVVRSGTDWQDAATFLYFAVAAAMLIHFWAKIFSLYRLKANESKQKRDGYWLIESGHPDAPFSFVNLLFWPKHLTFKSAESNTMLQHEMAHIKQRHSLDKVLLHLVVVACWGNPFFWLIRRELSLQHEYLADQAAINDNDTEAFARMLLCATYGISGNTIANAFFQSSIKKRLTMLTRNSTMSKIRFRGFLAIPVLAISLGIFSFSNTENVVRARKTVHVILDAAHGGKDLGGSNASGDLEKDLTLRISKELMTLGEAYNIHFTLTRTGDNTKSLEDRLAMSNGSNADLFVSVHVNKDAKDDMRGNDFELGVNAQGLDTKQNQLLASAVGDRLKAQHITTKVVNRHNVYVIRENKHTALLLACGNIDDQANMAMLKDDKRLESFCRSVLSGIVDYENAAAK
ncbi:M56/M15 family metallopeptidase [Taibaiella soli]|uniref:N-acetylmuramoyl-L-alanine amidase n=1 Tax=Taibaiella soli TaxID=1649169 RepID=A0A2W2AF26_9BACT|nr:M56/M15 family metallopeptidase [Taibaiella soli]PZF70760.1 hypothetical protein DN068_21835 [Taibaiella soli]